MTAEETFLSTRRRISEAFLAFMAGENQINSQQNQRNTQPLADIQGHVHLFCHLRILHELQSEAGTEENNQGNTGNQSHSFLQMELVIHGPGYNQCHQAVEHFVNLRRVTRLSYPVLIIQFLPFTRTDKFKSPRQGSRETENLGIHQVTETDTHADYGHRRYHPVEQPPYTLFGNLLGIPYQRQDQGEYPTVAGQSTFPYFQDFYRMCSIIIPFIKQTMSQSGSDYTTYNTVDKQLVRPVVGIPFFFQQTGYHFISQNESQSPHQSVPADFYRT